MQKVSNEDFILKVIKYVPLVFIVIASLLITFYISYNYKNTLKIEKEKIEKNYIQFNKDTIKENINTVDKYIINKNNKSNNLLKEQLKSEIHNVHKMMTSIYNKYNGIKTKEEIIEIIKTSLENFRFNKERGYFSVHTIEGVNVFHPIEKKFEGTLVFYRKDLQGKYPVQEAIDIAKSKGEGFFTWYYFKPKNKTKQFEKIGIVKRFAPYDLIITTAEYVEDFENQLKKEILEYIKNLEYKDTRYLFVIDKKGDFLLTRTKFLNVSDIDKNNLFVKSYYNFMGSKDEEKYLEYEFTNQNKNNSEKIAYFKKIKTYDWVIGTGFNLDNLNLQIKEKQKELERYYYEQIYSTLIIAVIMTILLLIISMFISKLLRKGFLDYKENLEKQVIKNQNQKVTLLRAQEVAHIGDWKLDLQTNKTFWSNEIIRIFGFNKKDKDTFGPELLKSIMIKEDLPCFENSLSNCINKGKEHNCIYRIKRPDNKIRWIDCRGRLNKDKSSIIGTIQDITENKTLEIEKHQKDELLYQQSKMAAMGEMIGNIAHQWRQPLSVISTASTGAKLQKEMNCLSDSELIDSLTAINTSAQYLSSVIDDFKNFFNPSNNKITEFDIEDTFSKTLNLVKAQFTSKDIEIIQSIEKFKIASIENELIQVLINILNNARDALITKENHRRLIFINTYIKDNILYLEIKDNAGGIEEKNITRVFEPYFTTKHKSQGTGIGLYMSKEIIEKHLNGKLNVSNETYIFEDIKYLGACFTIELTSDITV